MTSIRVELGDAQTWQSWTDYLGQGGEQYVHPKLICRHLARGYPGKDAYVGPEQWAGFPWLTLVLGSGCLETPESSAINPTDTAHAVKEVLTRDPLGARTSTRVDDLPGSVAEFVDALVRDRIDWPQPHGESVSVDVHVLAARMSVAAAFLTETFHLIQAGNAAPATRFFSDEKAVLDLENFDESADKVIDLLELVETYCAAIETDLASGDEVPGLEKPLAERIRAFLERLRTGLSPKGVVRPEYTVRLWDVRIVTDIAWFLLTLNTGIYPGWTDLLFRLSLRDDWAKLDHTRPRFNSLREHGELIRDLLTNAHQTSCENRDATPIRRDFYNRAATVLWAESSRARQVTRLPAASAFVTSFDLELELSLLEVGRERDEARDFFAVIPVFVSASESDPTADPCWLRATFHVSDGARDLREPAAWEVLADTPDNASLLAGPHVIHVNGCPLLDLPNDPRVLERIAETMGRTKNQRNDSQAMTIVHAVTLDEYSAIRQAQAELEFQLSERRNAREQTNRSLPDLLVRNSSTTDGKGLAPRMWVAIGVPMGDPAVRHRLVTQLAMGREPEPASGGRWSRPTPRLGGAVVSRRMNEDEEQVLKWIDLDVVHDRASSLSESLEHYAKHIDSGLGWNGIPSKKTLSCAL